MSAAHESKRKTTSATSLYLAFELGWEGRVRPRTEQSHQPGVPPERNAALHVTRQAAQAQKTLRPIQ
jgi:hypothetical protein